MKNGVAEQNITWEACKCDRLDKEEFRRRYIRHRCEYHKTTGTALSEYERKEKEIRDQNTIGNFIILPMELAHCRETYKPIRTHMAKFLCRLERCLCCNGRQCS